MFTAEELRVRCGLDANDASHDATLTAMEAAAVAVVQRETGRNFGPVANLAETFDGGGVSLWLASDPNPADAVTGVDRWNREDAAWEAQEGTDYRVIGRQVIRADGAAWERGYTLWRVRYPAGYQAGEEPPDIREAVIAMVKASFAAETAGGSAGMESEKIGDYQYKRLPVGTMATMADGRTVADVLASWNSHAWIG